MTQDKGASSDEDRAAGLRPQPATPFSQSSIPSALIALAERCEAFTASAQTGALLLAAYRAINQRNASPLSTFKSHVNAEAYLSAARSLLPKHTLWAIGNMEEGPFARLCVPMPGGGYAGGYIETKASATALALCAAALRAHAEVIEAGTGETACRLDPKDESAVSAGHSPV